MSGTLKSILSNRNFMLLWLAYGISALGDHFSEMAILAHLDALNLDVDITPLQARMTFLFMLPFLIFGPVSGALADRLPRRWVMISADLARVGIMVAFFWLMERCTPHFGEWGVFIPLGMVGCFAALFSPSRAAMVPTLVRSDELVSANALIGGLGMIATMFAALIGGEFAARGWIRPAFYVDAGTFAMSAICVWFITKESSRRMNTARRDVKVEPFFTSIVSGIRYILTHRRVAQLIGIAVIFWFSGAAVRSVIPAIVKHAYEGGFPQMARFPAWIGIGLACGAMIVLLLGNALRSDIAITWSMFGTSMAITCLAATVLIDFDPHVAHVLGAIATVFAGLFGAGISISYNALIQRFVSNRYRGRVYGIFNVATISGLLIATGFLSIPQWRNLDQWAGYILIGVAVLLFAVGWMTLDLRLRRARTTRTYAFLRGLAEVMTKFWYRLQRLGYCTIPRSGPVIVASNHGSFIDPMLIYSTCSYREIGFMIADEYKNTPVAKHFIRVARCIPVRRGQKDITATKMAISRLRMGEVVGIFIQGGIRPEGEPEQLMDGVATLALRTGATVIPIHISGTRHCKSVFKVVLMRHRARVVFGPPVDLSEFERRVGVQDYRRQESIEAATRKIFGAINALEPKPADQSDMSAAGEKGHNR